MVEAVDPTDAEREGIHGVERRAERIHRAHGALVEFHHAVGRAMGHFETAEWAVSKAQPDPVEATRRERESVAGRGDDSPSDGGERP